MPIASASAAPCDGHPRVARSREPDPPVPIATLILPKQDLDLQLQQDMEGMAFNPWNTTDFTPLGLINLARKDVYDASASHRGAAVNSRGQ